MKLLVVNVDKCLPGTLDQLLGLGLDYICTEGPEVPAVQVMPTPADRRFDAAVAALDGAYRFVMSTPRGRGEVPAAVAALAVETADALLKALGK